MRISTVFNKLLSLQGAWVRHVVFTAAAIVVTVARKGSRHRCPKCGFSTRAAYDRGLHTWRHLALGKWTVLVQAELCRVDCPEHGVLVEAVPWAEAGSRFTRDFEDLVAWLTREMNITAVTRLAHVSWATVSRIVERVVGRKLDAKRLEDLYVIGLDEVSYRKGHKYLTIVANHGTGDPAWIGEGRSRESLRRFFDELGPERRAKVNVVTMDMAAAYVEEVRAQVPDAVICFDPFHVVKLANEALTDVRRSEARTRKGTPEAAVLKGSRWTLLKAPENLKPDEHVRLADVAALNRSVYRGYLLKEELRSLFLCRPKAAVTHLNDWLAWASRSKLAPFVKLARTVRQHATGILDTIRLGVSNGRLEGLNNKVGVLKHRAYGFHSAAALIAMIWLCCSKLPVELPI